MTVSSSRASSTDNGGHFSHAVCSATSFSLTASPAPATKRNPSVCAACREHPGRENKDVGSFISSFGNTFLTRCATSFIYLRASGNSSPTLQLRRSLSPVFGSTRPSANSGGRLGVVLHHNSNNVKLNCEGPGTPRRSCWFASSPVERHLEA